MREVLNDLELMSHVPATGYQPTGRSPGSDEHPGGKRPPGDKGHTYFAQAYGPPFSHRTTTHPGCVHDTQRAHVLENARQEVAHLKGLIDRPAPQEESAEQMEARMVHEGEGFPAEEVAMRFRTGVSRVRKARERAGREQTYGRELKPEPGLPTAERRRRARELRDPPNNLPIPAIAAKLGVDKGTISRDLGRT